MKRVLDNIEPKNVFRYFEDICNIPHVSGNTAGMSDYCEQFAISHKLDYSRDVTGNVIIRKPATPGYENHPGVIIQGHLDMVGAKEDASAHDFSSEPLKLCEDELANGYITAKGTTLGGDDGIAVAYALAILEDSTLKHPAIEAVFTIDEETGMDGAIALDYSSLKGKYLLNIDSEDEGTFLTGSAGGMRSDISLPVERVTTEGMRTVITIAGLKGGHSGTEIGTGRPSANLIAGRLLRELDRNIDYYLESLWGGVVDNAITPKALVTIIIDDADCNHVEKACAKLQEELRRQYEGIDDEVTVKPEFQLKGYYEAVDDMSRDRITALLRIAPYGVMARNPYNDRLIETSLNPGVLRLDSEGFKLCYSIRSSRVESKKELADRLVTLAEYLGGTTMEHGDYAAWPYKPESRLRDIITDTYMDMYNKKPEFETIHAGLECGLFSQKLPELDIVSYGPDMEAIHTYNEKLYIESTRRVYEFTVKLLERL